jgi:hypothetical protein
MTPKRTTLNGMSCSVLFEDLPDSPLFFKVPRPEPIDLTITGKL